MRLVTSSFVASCIVSSTSDLGVSLLRLLSHSCIFSWMPEMISGRAALMLSRYSGVISFRVANAERRGCSSSLTIRVR